MKVIFTVFLLVGSLLSVPALPASSKPTDDVEIIPSSKYPYGDQPVVDTGIVGFGGPISNPFNGLFENLEAMMTRMRQQMESLFKRLPGVPRGNETDEFPVVPLSEGALGILPGFGDIDLSKGNTTSVTKVIDGHKVVINETEYRKEDDFGGAFFKVRIVDVKPDSSEVTTIRDTEEVTPSSVGVKDREPLENSIENEIIKSREEAHFQNLETFDDVDASHYSPDYLPTSSQYVNREWDDIDETPVEIIDDNSISFQPADLSRDTYVNQILANSGAPTNPDAEVIFGNPQVFPTEPNKFRLPR